MECALCKLDRKLSNSHIVPEFIFKKLQGKEKEFYAFQLEPDKLKKFHQTFREKLLCAECETKFSQWESYAKTLIFGGMPISGRKMGRHFVIDGVNYAKLKLFFMSLLWRFSVSSNPWFKGTDLGIHREKLRLLLLNSDPAEFWRYGCLFVPVMESGTHLPDLIVAPTKFKVNGQHGQRVVVGGFLLNFFVSNKPPSKGKEGLLQEDGRFLISPYDIREIPFLAEVLDKVSQKDLD